MSEATTWNRIRRSPGTMIGLALVLAHALVAIFAPWIAPYEVTSIVGFPMSPIGTPDFLLGTDNIGRDYLSRLMMGGRTSIFVALVAIAGSVAGASFLAISAAYIGGHYDDIVMRMVDTMLAIPGILFVALIVTGFGRSEAVLIFAIGFSYMPGAIRVIRSHALTIVPLGYVQAARLRGISVFRIFLRELLPNCIEIITVEFALRMSSSILAVSALSFLGLGISPPTPDWGLMIAEAVKTIYAAPMLVLLPSLFISTLVVGLNLASDGLANAIGLDAARGLN
jgi:peptide/nickel transport system permease protein